MGAFLMVNDTPNPTAEFPLRFWRLDGAPSSWQCSFKYWYNGQTNDGNPGGL
jgi:hypothetical protein